MTDFERVTHTVDEVASMLGISRGSAYAAVAQGEIPSVKVGRRLLVPRAALERLLAEASNTPAAGSPTVTRAAG